MTLSIFKRTPQQRALIVRSFAMKARIKRQTSWHKRAVLLLRFGLIAGCIPTWTPDELDQEILDSVLNKPDGANVAPPKAV